jgi:hypothetical protein
MLRWWWRRRRRRRGRRGRRRRRRRRFCESQIVVIFVYKSLRLKLVELRFHHHIFATNVMTNLLTKLSYKQISYIFVLFVSQKCVANQIGLLKTQ